MKLCKGGQKIVFIQASSEESAEDGQEASVMKILDVEQ